MSEKINKLNKIKKKSKCVRIPSPPPGERHMRTIPKSNVNILQVHKSGVTQKQLPTEDFKEFYYIIKMLIIDYQLYTLKKKLALTVKQL